LGMNGLILVVQKHPILYDMTFREFKDTRKKDQFGTL